jgi:serine/tyrosine/threonine adenylyltransferase
MAKGRGNHSIVLPQGVPQYLSWPVRTPANNNFSRTFMPMPLATTPPGWNFNNSYAKLPGALFAPVLPTQVAAPQVVLLNQRLATSLGLDFSAMPPSETAALLSGNALPPGATPMAQAYAGHQFGHFNVLGDGRAILLGEQIGPDGQRTDLQLKGAGPTPYSRRGDGRATLSAMLREYIMSEAMYHLGIPTTGSLAVTITGEKVYREQTQNGAVLVRTAASHIRVGTFEFASRLPGKPALEALLQHAIRRHYPQLEGAGNPALALLEAVLGRQVTLAVEWMRVGFIHGVMNTDNVSIAGETIDYGPCAFMNRYHPQTAFSSIDHQGRYAYANQPIIAQWNLVQLASALLPLIHEEPQKGIEPAQAIIDTFPILYQGAWLNMMRRKLGWAGQAAGDAKMVQGLLQWMETAGADYTNTFLLLQAVLANEGPLAQLLENLSVLGNADRERPHDEEGFKKWLADWRQRVSAEGQTAEAALALMQQSNPRFIPRNHRVEAALEAATLQQDYAPLHTLLQVLQKPYTSQSEHVAYQLPPLEDESRYQTFCNT